jgi:hypothetical protein
MAPTLLLPPPVVAAGLGDALEQVLRTVLGADRLPVAAMALCANAETILATADEIVVEPDGVFVVRGTDTEPCDYPFEVPDITPRISVRPGGIIVHSVLWQESGG